MNAWLTDENGQLLAVYSQGKLRVQPGADRDQLLLLVTRLFGEMLAPQQQMVFSGGHRYWEAAAAAGNMGTA